MGFFSNFFGGGGPSWYYDPSRNNQFYDQYFGGMRDQNARDIGMENQRYADMTRLLKSSLNTTRKGIRGQRKATLADLKRGFGEANSMTNASMVNRGLGNTTALDTQLSGNRERYNQSVARARQGFAAQEGAIADEYKLLAQAAGNRQRTPNMSPYYRLMQQMAQTGQMSGPPPGWGQSGFDQFLGSSGGQLLGGFLGNGGLGMLGGLFGGGGGGNGGFLGNWNRQQFGY